MVEQLMSFLFLCLASQQISRLFVKIHLPAITGYLFTGILIGPNVLSFVDANHVMNLSWIDELALAFITFSAGSELFWKDVKPKLRTIFTQTFANILVIVLLCGSVFYVLSGQVVGLAQMSTSARIGVALLAGIILVARSPSSAIAIVDELKAKGPLTQVILGVTVIIDILVITLFTMAFSLIEPLLSNKELNSFFLLQLMAQLALSITLGLLLSRIINFIISLNMSEWIKLFLLVSIGFLTFEFSHAFYNSFSFHLEPLLMCMVCGFYIANFTKYNREFVRIVNMGSPTIYLCFFTLVGASVSFDALINFWPYALVLFFLRVFSIFIASYFGGVLSDEPKLHNRVSWMCYITQAGVGLGLTRQVSENYADWGNSFATILISVIIINEILGPIFIKWALHIVKEATPKAKKSEKNAVPKVVIVGKDHNAATLSLQLCAHNWLVTLLKLNEFEANFDYANLSQYRLGQLDEGFLEQLHLDEETTFVVMLSDNDNMKVFSQIRSLFPDCHVVIALEERSNINRYEEDKNLSFVDPTTSMISLLDHYVRTPSAVSLLLGYEKDQDIIECEIRNSHLKGKSLFELNLPSEVLILSIKRKGQNLNIHGGIRLELFDRLTLVGPNSSLQSAKFKISFIK